MTAAREEETTCVSHVLPLTKCQFDVITIYLPQQLAYYYYLHIMN